MKKIILLLAFVILFSTLASAHIQPMQGKIQLDGANVFDGGVKVYIYNSPILGDLIYTESFLTSVDSDGHFSINLGDTTDLDTLAGEEYWFDLDYYDGSEYHNIDWDGTDRKKIFFTYGTNTVLSNSSNLENYYSKIEFNQSIQSITNINNNLTVNGTIKSNNIETMFINYTESGDDAGVIIQNGQFSVGSPLNPKESVFGGGDSTTEGMIIFHYDGLFTDVTTIMASDTNSHIGLFGGVTSGNSIYVGSDFTYGGVKAKINTSGDIDANNVIAEYWNGTHWDSVNFMATDSNYPYAQHSNMLATHSGSQQWRFGVNTYIWEKSTINGIEKYWGRFTIDSDITTDPEIEQLKLHTNRFEINDDGSTEYFGISRYSKDLTMHWHLTEELEGFAPADENIDFANGISIKYKKNEFQDGKIDGRAGYLILPQGIDTSIPLSFEVLWQPMTNDAGDVFYQLLTSQAKVGDVMDTSKTPTTFSATETIISNQDNVLMKTSLTVDISELLPGEILAFAMKRIGTDTDDTYTGGVALINIRAVGYFWKP